MNAKIEVSLLRVFEFRTAALVGFSSTHML